MKTGKTRQQATKNLGRENVLNFSHVSTVKRNILPLVEEEMPADVRFENFRPQREERSEVYRTVERLCQIAPSSSTLELSVRQNGETNNYGITLILRSYQGELHLQHQSPSLSGLMETIFAKTSNKLNEWKKQRFMALGGRDGIIRETAS